MRRSRLALLTLLAAGAASAWAQSGPAGVGTSAAPPAASTPATPLSPAEFAVRDAILIPLPGTDVPASAPSAAPAAASPATPSAAESVPTVATAPVPAAPRSSSPPPSATPPAEARAATVPAAAAPPPSLPPVALPPAAMAVDTPAAAPAAAPPAAVPAAVSTAEAQPAAPSGAPALGAAGATPPAAPADAAAADAAMAPVAIEDAPPPEPAGPPTVRLALQSLYAEPSGDVLLQGEEPSASFVVPVPPGIGTGAARLEIVYRSGIDMLPEQSHLTLSIDGRTVDEIEPAAFSEEKTWSIPVVLTGQSQLAVTIAARQSHRLLCGPQASYELWTAIDLARSGLSVELPQPVLPATLDEALGALQLNIAAGASVTLVPAAAIDDLAVLKPLVDAAQALGLRADRLPLRVVVAPAGQVPAADPASPLPPAVIVIGSAADVGRLVPALDPGSVTGPTLTLAAPPGGGPSLLVATGRTPDEILGAVRRIAPDGALAARNGTSITQGGTYTLAALGVADRDVRAHRERIDIDFRLPSDLYAADGSPVRFMLDAAYAPALESGAALTMTVNGVSTGIVRLSQVAGELLRRREIDLPFLLFRPGDNRVSVELAIPVATPDRPCPPLTDKDDPLFTLFASSTLTFPPFAHLQQLPDLRLFADGGTPYADDGVVDFVVPAPDAQTLSAAATVAARLAAAAGRPLHLEPAVAWPRTSSRDKIVVAPVDALADDMLGGADLRRRDLIAALPLATDLVPSAASDAKSVETLVARITAERRAVEPAIPGRSGSAAAPAPDTAPADDSAARQSAWEDRLNAADEPAWYDRILPDVQGIFADLEARITDQAQGETAAAFLGRVGGIPGGIVLQYPALQSTGTAVTVVTAADPAMLARAAYDLASDAVWPQLRGDLVAFGGAVTTPAFHMPNRSWNTLTEPLTAEGVYRLAPHWLSKHNAIWLGLVLGIALVAAIVTRLLLNRIGVRDGS